MRWLSYMCVYTQDAVTVEIVDDSTSVPPGLTVLGYDVTVSKFTPVHTAYTCTYIVLYMYDLGLRTVIGIFTSCPYLTSLSYTMNIHVHVRGKSCA